MARIPFNLRIIFKTLGFLLFIEAFFMLVTAGIGCLYHEDDLYIFLRSAGYTFAAGLALALAGWKARPDIGKHESFVIVTLVWILFSLFGSIPFQLNGSFSCYTDAFFESMSGFSTTGSSILKDVETLSHPILFWRSIIQWLGGMGIILLSLAIMPMIKFGSFQLFTAEVTGPVYEKLRPRLTETAKLMWFIYFGLTLAETVLLALGPMDWFDALCHSFTTMASGGFSTRNASIGYWNSAYIETIVTVFMFLAGTSFILMYWMFTGHFDKVRQNEEFRWYLIIVGCGSLLLALLLFFLQDETPGRAIRDGIFHVISIITTTGFTTEEFSGWNHCIQFLLVLLMCSGAMSGSTSGNIKIGRIILSFKTCFNEMKRDIHPNAVLPVMFNNKAMPQPVITSLFGFLFFYLVLVILSTGLFFSVGLDMDESLGVALTSIGNIGPGLGDYFTSFATLPGFAKWWMTFLMLVGRLEIYTVLLLFSKDFWVRA